MSFRIAVLILVLGGPLGITAQPLAGANFKSWYDARQEGTFRMLAVNTGDEIRVYYQCDTSRFDVRWDKRESYAQKTGDPLSDGTFDPDNQTLSFPIPAKPWLLVASVKNKADNELTMFFHPIEGNYPVDCLIRTRGRIEMKPYLYVNTPYTFEGQSSRLKVYRYSTHFSPAAAPFSEKESSADPLLESDSSFSINNNSPVTFKTEGLYLVQSDTGAARGTAFRVVNSAYPKLTQLEDLASALIFISTREEFERLQQAGKDKVKFDKVILDITRDKDRAKNVIRKYFRRVELANILFASFKEGWKTDRGMIYVIYGPPDEVSRSGGYEIWTYKKVKSKFVFERSASIYDPDNFTLQRDKKFMESWYYTVDMWRKNQVASADGN
jgi:GWxTD domain-containing protein